MQIIIKDVIEYAINNEICNKDVRKLHLVIKYVIEYASNNKRCNKDVKKYASNNTRYNRRCNQ